VAAARGVLYVHSAQPALCPHIEWAVAGVLGVPVNLTWTPQPAAPGTLRAQAEWVGRPGTAAAIASSLMGWQRIRFEITEDASPGVDGSRHAYTPSLGPFTAVIGANGDILVPENRLRTAMMLAAQGRAGAGRPGGGARPSARQAVGRGARVLPVRGGGGSGSLAARGRMTPLRIPITRRKCNYR